MNSKQASLSQFCWRQEGATLAPVEPSLTELIERLVDIKIDICNILRENEDMKNNMNVGRMSKYRTLNKAMKQSGDAERDLTETRKIVDQQEEEIADLYHLQDYLEQYTRKNSLEIHGNPEEAYETAEEVVLKLENALDVPLNPQDIEISHKLRRKGAKPIIIKFVSHKIKTNLYKAQADKTPKWELFKPFPRFDRRIMGCLREDLHI